jgi:hypothetical protein
MDHKRSEINFDMAPSRPRRARAVSRTARRLRSPCRFAGVSSIPLWLKPGWNELGEDCSDRHDWPPFASSLMPMPANGHAPRTFLRGASANGRAGRKSRRFRGLHRTGTPWGLKLYGRPNFVLGKRGYGYLDYEGSGVPRGSLVDLDGFDLAHRRQGGAGSRRPHL